MNDIHCAPHGEWKDRIAESGEICGNCRFWNHHHDKPKMLAHVDYELGTCHAHSPGASSAQTNTLHNLVTVWPRTSANDGCGDFDKL